MAYDNTNSGALFTNEEKKSEKHPDFSGKINVKGEDFYISGWKKMSKNNKKFISVSVKPVSEASRPAENNQAASSGAAW